MSFKETGLSEKVLAAVEAAGYTNPTPIQAQAIPHVLQGRDLLGAAQTGTGKTAAFGLPMIQRLVLTGDRPRTQKPRGLVLVTGTTGSGKSTTLAAMIDKINKERRDHILTIEDPIEYLFEQKQSLIDQREVKIDTKDFEHALVSAFRQDIDVLLVGEMRGHETMSAAVTAAETGHLVFSTLHTNSAAGALPVCWIWAWNHFCSPPLSHS